MGETKQLSVEMAEKEAEEEEKEYESLMKGDEEIVVEDESVAAVNYELGVVETPARRGSGPGEGNLFRKSNPLDLPTPP